MLMSGQLPPSLYVSIEAPNSNLLISSLHLLLFPSEPTMVLLVTSDNEQFVVDKDVAERSAMIKSTLDRKPCPFY